MANSRRNPKVAMAHLVMETLSILQKSRKKSSLKSIREHIVEKYGSGENSDAIMNFVPQYIMKGIDLGIITRYGDNYRTRTYITKPRKQPQRPRNRNKKQSLALLKVRTLKARRPARANRVPKSRFKKNKKLIL